MNTKKVEKWFEENSYSMDQLNHVFSVFEKIMNIAFTSESTRKKILGSKLKSSHFDLEKSNLIVETEYRSNFNNKTVALRYINESKETLLSSYYQWKEKLRDDLKKAGYGTLSVKKLKSSQRSLNIQDCILLERFHFSIGLLIETNTSEMFDLKNLTYDMATQLVLIDTLTNGFGHDEMNKIAEKSVFTKDKTFFECAHPSDFFVYDRMSVISKNKMKYIVSYKDHLMTTCYDTLDEMKKRMNDKIHFSLMI